MTHEWPEIVISSKDNKTSQAIRRAHLAGKLYKIAPRVYTSNFKDSPETIIKRHRHQILGELFPQAIISHRSALDGGIATDGSIVLTYKYTKKVQLPGLTIRFIKGPGPDVDDFPFLNNLFISSQARALLENMQVGRKRDTGTCTFRVLNR